MDEDSSGLGQVRITIPSEGSVALTDNSGNYVLEVAKEGRYTLEFERLGYRSVSRDVTVETDPVVLNIVMAVDPISLPSMTITAKPRPSLLDETSNSVSILEGRELERLRGQSVIAAIEHVRGVAAVSSGVMSLKPVIRGLGFQRVVLLEDGVRHETQQWDDDDSPAIDAMGNFRIEVVRGPGSVLYGSDALGGVINIVQNSAVGNHVDSTAMRGEITLNGFSSNRQVAGILSVNGLLAPISYEAQLSLRRASNVRTPVSVLPNTGAKEINGQGSIMFRNSIGNLRIGFSHFDQEREILTEPNEHDEEPYQTTKHSRFHFSFQNTRTPLRWDISGGYQVNDVAEYEKSEAGIPRINLRLGTISMDAKAHHSGIVGSFGTIGANVQIQRNRTLGEEPLIPGFRQYTAAGFIFEEFQQKNFNFSAGLRYDVRLLKTELNEELNIPNLEKTFNAFTASVGGLWHISRAVILTLNTGKGWRAPIAEELFVDGIEEGSLRYKIGNRDLQPEESYSVEVESRIFLSKFSSVFSLFYNRITRYIYLAPTGELDSVTSVEKYRHSQSNAVLWGSEIDLRYQILQDIFILGGIDLLWGKNTNSRTWLPLMPPHRMEAGIEYASSSSFLVANPHLNMNLRFFFNQNRVDVNEEPTAEYTLVDVTAGGDMSVFGHTVFFDCVIRNLFDRAYRDHLSLYKQYALNPGIDVSLKISVPFTVVR